MSPLKTKLSIVALSFVAAFALSPSAQAATTVDSFGVSASVPVSCKILEAPDINVGEYDTNAVAEKEVTFIMRMQCTLAQGSNPMPTVAVSISQGMNAAPGSTCDNPLRRMKSADGQYLNYRIDGYSSGRGFGCGVGYQNPQDAPAGISFSRVYAFNSPSFSNGVLAFMNAVRVPAGQDVGKGVYTDTLTVTLDF